ncbi:MAG: hypothetical protein AAGK28_13600, partial [Pseudomonadota bacterium]
MKRLVILGCGGHARVAAEIAELTGYKEIAFLGPDKSTVAEKGSWSVLGQDDDETLEGLRANSTFFVGVGENVKRANLIRRLLAKDLEVISLVHPR